MKLEPEPRIETSASLAWEVAPASPRTTHRMNMRGPKEAIRGAEILSSMRGTFSRPLSL